jgi:NAD(P)-dependent dehydrogenase (short-subunit alcohol dehydrogenase family)
VPFERAYEGTPVTDELRHQVAIVTGAASGIGRAVATCLAEHGCAIALLDLNEDGLLETEKAIAQRGQVARSFALDLENSAGIPDVFEAVLQQFNRVDILINSAGISGSGAAVLDVDEATWDRVFAVNAKAPFILMKLAAKRMIAQNGGRIVNVTSGAAHRARQSQAAYGGSKAALTQLTRTAAAEFGSYGINVNAVAPGLTLTPMVAGVMWCG